MFPSSSMVVKTATTTVTTPDAMPAGTLNRLPAALRNARIGAHRATPIMARKAAIPATPPSTPRCSQKLSTVSWLVSRRSVWNRSWMGEPKTEAAAPP